MLRLSKHGVGFFKALLGLHRTEADLLANRLRQRLEQPRMLRKDPAVIQQNRFNPCEALGGLSLEVSELSQERGLVRDGCGLALNQARHRLFQPVVCHLPCPCGRVCPPALHNHCF